MKKSKLDTYLNLCTQVYDISLPTPPADEYAFFTSYAAQSNGPILEPMCGTGRFLLPMIKDGFDVEGFDASEHMLRALFDKATRLNLAPQVSCSFITDFESAEKYGLIFIPSGSFNLIVDRQDITKALTKFYDLLLPGGVLIIEIITLAATPQDTGVWRRERWARPDRGFILASAMEKPLVDNVSNTICRYELVENNFITKTEEEVVKIRLYSQQEFYRLLLDVRFSLVRPLKAFSRSEEPDLDDKDIVFECIK